jgi:hypothetical protein
MYALTGAVFAARSMDRGLQFRYLGAEDTPLILEALNGVPVCGASTFRLDLKALQAVKKGDTD